MWVFTRTQGPWQAMGSAQALGAFGPKASMDPILPLF